MDVESRATIDEAVDRAVAALTAQRQALTDDLHGLLDRVNGTKLVMTDGGFELVVPPRK